MAKKVCIISKFYPPQTDGVGDHSYQLQKRLSEHGFSCSVFYEQVSLPFCKQNVDEMVSAVQEFKADHIIVQYVGYSFSRLGAPFWLVKFLSKLKKDNPVKIHLFVHETYIRKGKSLKTGVYSKLQRLCLKELCGTSDFIYSNLGYYQAQINALGFKCELCPTPSNLENNYQNELYTNVSDRHKTIFSAFGNRDYSYAIEILKILDKSKISFEFHIFGKIGGDFLTKLRSVLETFENGIVKLHGRCTEEQIISGLQRCNFFLFPEYVSKDGEGGLNTKSGTSATAFMLGLPVVSTCGDMTDDRFFNPDKNFIPIPTFDSAKAAIKIKNYINHPERLEAIRKEAKLLYETRMSWNMSINTLKKCLNANVG